MFILLCHETQTGSVKIILEYFLEMMIMSKLVYEFARIALFQWKYFFMYSFKNSVFLLINSAIKVVTPSIMFIQRQVFTSIILTYSCWTFKVNNRRLQL